VYVRLPSASIAGCAANSAWLSLSTWKSSTCADSSAGPALRSVAQPVTVCAPESSNTDSSAPATNDGASVTALTVNDTVAADESSVPSFTVYVKLAGPL